METGRKYLLLGIFLFPLTLFFLSIFIFPKPEFIQINIHITDFDGLDTNNDTRVDTIDVFIANSGTTSESITKFDFSQMSKNWVLTNTEYPVEIEPLVFEEYLLLSAVTNQDQITLEDNIHVKVYLASKGSVTPAIIIENRDLLRIEEEEFVFELKEEQRYDYLIDPYFNIFYFPPDFPLRLFVSSVISFSPLAIYLVVEISRGKIKPFKNKIMDK